jgi:hypothetical protein
MTGEGSVLLPAVAVGVAGSESVMSRLLMAKMISKRLTSGNDGLLLTDLGPGLVGATQARHC